MTKSIVFDMDGTLCDTYNQENSTEREGRAVRATS